MKNLSRTLIEKTDKSISDYKRLNERLNAIDQITDDNDKEVELQKILEEHEQLVKRGKLIDALRKLILNSRKNKKVERKDKKLKVSFNTFFIFLKFINEILVTVVIIFLSPWRNLFLKINLILKFKENQKFIN